MVGALRAGGDTGADRRQIARSGTRRRERSRIRLCARSARNAGAISRRARPAALLGSRREEARRSGASRRQARISAKERSVSEHTYKHIELTGSSTKSSDDAVRNALAQAAKTVRNLHWFQVIETRGHIVDGEVA